MCHLGLSADIPELSASKIPKALLEYVAAAERTEATDAEHEVYAPAEWSAFPVLCRTFVQNEKAILKALQERQALSYFQGIARAAVSAHGALSYPPHQLVVVCTGHLISCCSALALDCGWGSWHSHRAGPDFRSREAGVTGAPKSVVGGGRVLEKGSRDGDHRCRVMRRHFVLFSPCFRPIVAYLF